MECEIILDYFNNAFFGGQGDTQFVPLSLFGMNANKTNFPVFPLVEIPTRLVTIHRLC